MKNYTEKRAWERYNQEAAITYAHFNSNKFYRGKTTNYSKKGIYFESDLSLKPGANIYIRIENYSFSASCSKDCDCMGVRMLALAEVKWCKEISGSDGSYYGAGLKYLEPAYNM